MADTQAVEDARRESMNAEGKYRFASIVELTRDDPVNGYDEGQKMIIEGRCDDGVAYHVLCDEKEGFLPITCDVVERFEAESWTTREEIREWASGKAEESRWGRSE